MLLANDDCLPQNHTFSLNQKYMMKKHSWVKTACLPYVLVWFSTFGYATIDQSLLLMPSLENQQELSCACSPFFNATLQLKILITGSIQINCSRYFIQNSVSNHISALYAKTENLALIKFQPGSIYSSLSQPFNLRLEKTVKSFR